MIYKIVPRSIWEDAERAGEFAGAGIDLQDGYIHFSTSEQAQETADKHYVGQNDLLLVAVDETQFDEEMKWEPSRGGALFPHLYGVLKIEQATSVTEIQMTKDGRHLIDAS